MNSTERNRRYRERQRQGVVMLARVPVNYELLAMLVEAGHLEAREDENGKRHIDKANVGPALALAVEEWADGRP